MAFLTAAQSTPSRSARVDVSVANVTQTGSVNLVVWAPEFPISITSSRTVLKPMRGVGTSVAGTSSSCLQAYQSAALAVLANVSSGEGVRYLVDVTADVATNLVVSDPQLAFIEQGNGTGSVLRLRGLSAGQGSVQLVRNGTTVATASVVVSNDSSALYPVRLQLFTRG